MSSSGSSNIEGQGEVFGRNHLIRLAESIKTKWYIINVLKNDRFLLFCLSNQIYCSKNIFFNWISNLQYVKYNIVWWHRSLKKFTAVSQENFIVRTREILLNPSADLEVQLVQLNHCNGVYNNYWNTLLRNLKLSPYIKFYV